MRWRRRKAREEDLEREIESHLSAEAAVQMEHGAAEDEARYAVQRALGNATLIKEDVRATWAWTALERLEQDLRYAVRQIRKAPGFAITVVLSFALGIGANSALFAVTNAVLLRMMPVHERCRPPARGRTATCGGRRGDWVALRVHRWPNHSKPVIQSCTGRRGGDADGGGGDDYGRVLRCFLTGAPGIAFRSHDGFEA